MSITVHTQVELDAALAAAADVIYIESEAGVWLTLTNSRSSRVEARGSSRVEAWESSRVEAWGSSRVEARGSSHVEASRFVAVHLHSSRVTLSGNGVVIDVTQLDLEDPQQWADYVGAKVDGDGCVVLYKAVRPDGTSDRGMAYPVGETVTAPDWRDDHDCGGGLHLSPSPVQARSYADSGWESRFLACRVVLADVRSIGSDKCKVPACVVLHEVDVFGEPVAAEAVSP